MIPRIANLPQINLNYKHYAQALHRSGFSGDIELNYASRLLCATDNSVYQCMPSLVIFPKSETDIVTALKLGQDPEFKDIVFAPRGGGTGTNGQSLCRGVIIDASRYLKGVRNFDQQKREITVQPGCIKDEINELIKPHGLFFSPELSTSSRATIGGMISNDAAGQGSLKYGRTSCHIKRVRLVLIDGTVMDLGELSGQELKAKLELQNREGEIYRKIYALLKSNAPKVAAIFPKLNRFMTGYDMAHAYLADQDILNLCRLVCGAEGTLGFVSEAVLDLTPLPAFRSLLVIKYANFDAALRDANDLVAAGALSVETVDSKVLNLAKHDPVWLGVKDYITEIPGHEILGVNIVEFAGRDAQVEADKLKRLYTLSESKAKTQQGGVLGSCIADTPAAIAAIYAMRKKAVGLLNSAATRAKLVAFTEDTAVPPAHLADYIKDFRALLDSMQVSYGMFGHVDAGVMHVRPSLDLAKPEDREKLIAISDAVVKLVDKYGGQMWGEHGRGYRAKYGRIFFKELYPEARRIKALFDPLNRVNPGKICVPWGVEGELVDVGDPMRGDLDRMIALPVRNSFAGAMDCNGNGQCFGYQRTALMCPSYRYTHDHVHSPKGYSALMREWLRLMSERGINPLAAETEIFTGSRGPMHWLKRCFNTLSHQEDFNQEYLEAIKTCLACKSCKTMCPAHVNAADLNSRFMSFYYDRYLRPRMDLLLLNAEAMMPLLGKFPKLGNLLVHNPLNTLMLRKIFGFVDTPRFSERNLAQCCADSGVELLSYRRAVAAKPDVVIVADPFTAAYEAHGLAAWARLIKALGFSVAVLRPYVNGKILVVRGARRQFVRFASKQAARLEALAHAGITLVGYDPALTLCYRDEYKQLLGAMRGEFEVLLPEEWLSQALAQEKVRQLMHKFKSAFKTKAAESWFNQPFYLFCHCTEQALIPASVRTWQEIMQAFDLNLIPVPVSCCGMAGLHGHMLTNQDESRQVYNSCWGRELKRRDHEHCLATGFSCRLQVHRMEHYVMENPLQVLEKFLTGIMHAGA